MGHGHARRCWRYCTGRSRPVRGNSASMSPTASAAPRPAWTSARPWACIGWVAGAGTFGRVPPAKSEKGPFRPHDAAVEYVALILYRPKGMWALFGAKTHVFGCNKAEGGCWPALRLFASGQGLLVCPDGPVVVFDVARDVVCEPPNAVKPGLHDLYPRHVGQEDDG